MVDREFILDIDYHNTQTLRLSDEGEIIIKSYDRLMHGLSYVYPNVDIISNIKTKVDKMSVGYGSNLGQFICSELLNQNIYARVVGKNDPYMDKFKVVYSYTNPYFDTLDKLRHMVRVGNDKFRFHSFITIEKNNLFVKFVGHEVGGSYVPDTEVIPLYIERIQERIGKRVKFIERISGGFGFDIYIFSINLKRKL